ncbi:putative ribonuclease H-like domain-containing protein [Tanacetum coccineum]
MNKENIRRVVPVETTTSNSLISCDGLGDYDWSDQAEEGLTNFALMAYSFTSSNSEVSTDLNCSSSCLENVKILKEQNKLLLKDLRTSKINAITYKTGLESVEARLLVYKKNESVYEEDIKVLKRNFLPPKHDFSFSGLEEFVNEPIVSEPTAKKFVVETSEAKASADKPKAVRKNNGALIIEDWVFDSEEEDVSQAKKEKKTVKSSFAKIEFVKSKEQVKSLRKTIVNHVNQNRQNTHTFRGNQKNWNNMMSQRLGSNFEMFNKACHVCGSVDHLQYDCNNHQRLLNNKKMVKPVWNYTQRVNHQFFSRMTHPSPKRNMVPKGVLIRSGLVSLTTTRPVNTAQPKTTVNSARPMINVFNKAHSTVSWPINNKTTTKNRKFNQRVNIVNGKNVNTARPKAVVNAARPKAQDLEEKGLIDSGCSRHMIGNMSYLTDFEEIDEGYVAFGGNPKRGKITGRGTIKNGNLDFENVYFVRELQFNLFSVSQMCDKKNSVLFNDTECIVLSLNFKLTDESHVLLKVPRKNNMYCVDLKNIVPKGGLTCLFAKATSDESKLCHRRLGHINFKTMNKLVKGNLVRDSNDETSGILKSFITGVENLIDQRVKVIRCDNRTEFKNKDMNQFCKRKADSKLPTTFWVDAVITACYVQNRVLVTKPHNKTPYERFLGRKPALSFMRPFGCPVIILNTIDHLGKFDGKADKGFFVGSGPNWLFDIDALTKLMNYKLVIAGNQSNGNVGTKACDDTGKASMETVPGKDYILLPLWPADPLFSQCLKSSPDAGFKPSRDNEKKVTEEPGKESGDSSKEDENNDQEKNDYVNCTNNVNAASTNEVNTVGRKSSIGLPDDLNMPELEDIVYSDDDEDVGAEAHINKLDTIMHVSPIPTIRIHKDHPIEQIIKDLNSAPQTRRMTKNLEEHGLFSLVQQRTNHKDFQNCLFACFLSQEEPKKTLVDLPNGKSAIGTKWVYKNKKDERGIVIKNKARLVAQGYTQEEGIDYDEIKEEVYVCQPPGYEDPDFPDRVYKVEKALYGLQQAPRAWYETLSTYLLDNGFQRGKIDITLFIRRDKVCGCVRYQVKPKVSHLHYVKRNFRYLKGQPKLGFWYPKDSPFDLVAYTDSDYAGASLDRKSTTGGCKFLGCRLISWQCKKQTVVANFTIKAEYVAASSCCGQVLWI